MRIRLPATVSAARVSATPRQEVDGFLAAMRTGKGERQRIERIPGNGARARLRPGPRAAAPAVEAEVRDIARIDRALDLIAAGPGHRRRAA